MHQLSLDLFLPVEKYTYQDFVLGNCNFLPFQWLERWPKWPTSVMALYGPPKSGKSYLAHIWQQKAQAYLWTIKQFEEKAWDEHLTDTHVRHFCIEGIPQKEQNFLHFFNALQQHQGTLLLVDQSPPAHWNIRLPDLKSRLNALPALGIGQPDEDFLKTLLMKLLADHQLKIPHDLIDYCVTRLPRSFEAIHLFVHLVGTANPPIGFTLIKNILNKVEEKIDC